MANPRSRRMFLIGATMLTAGVPVLADNSSSEKAPEVSTVVYGPQGPTPAEIAKYEAFMNAPAAAPTVAARPIGAPLIPKAAEVTTIVVGTTGLTSQELAKATAEAAPAPATTTTQPASAPAPTTPTPAPAEK